MRILDTQEGQPSAELESKIHTHHRGLTSVMLRRRGRAAFKSLQLEGKDGSSVGHREPPVDKPADIARAAWDALTEHAARFGSGAYEAELHFASGEKGPAPKAVVVPIAVGDDGVDLGAGTDPAVIVDIAMRLAQFSTGALCRFLDVLPKVATETTTQMSEVRKLGESMLEAMRNATSSSDRVEVARIEAGASRERLEFAKTFVEPGVAALKEAMGGAASTSAAARRAAATPAGTPAVTATATTPGAPATTQTPEQKRVVELGAKLSTSLTQSQLDALSNAMGPDYAKRAEALRTSTSHADVLTLLADILDKPKPQALAVLALLSNEQGDILEEVDKLAKKIGGPS